MSDLMLRRLALIGHLRSTAGSALFGAALILSTAPLQASLCDHRLSEVIAQRVPVLAAAASDLQVLRQMTLAQPDFFTLVDGKTGQSALGAVLTNTAALQAGAGLVAGAAQLLGAGGAVLSGPAIGSAAGLALLGIGGVEQICRFQREKISDYYEVLAILSAVADTADPALFQLQPGPARKKAAVVGIWDEATGIRQQYPVSDLYFQDGELLLSRWGRNRSLGYLVQMETLSRDFGPPIAP